MCDGHPKMMSSVPLLVLAFTTAFAAPAVIYDDVAEQVPQKRAALVLDRLLVALQKALQEEDNGAPYETDKDAGPQTEPLQFADHDMTDLVRRPHKRPALVLDQLLMAIQRALRARNGRIEALIMEEPHAVPVVAVQDLAMSSLERRGQPTPGRGRVLRCYFNAITCF